MKRFFSIFFLVSILTCEAQGILSFMAAKSQCCMMQCTPEKQKDCESSGKMPSCCRVCCLMCTYIVPEKIAINTEEIIKEEHFVFNEPLASFYIFDTFHPPELYI